MLLIFVLLKPFVNKATARKITWKEYFTDFVGYGSTDLFVRITELSHGIT